MDKPISSIMAKSVVVVRINDTVDRVEELLSSHKLESVPVIDLDGNCFGVISCTDLVHFHAMHENPRAKQAWEVCTHQVIEVSPDISVRKVAELMVENNIHHVLIMADRTIEGVVSSIDLVREYLLCNCSTPNGPPLI